MAIIQTCRTCRCTDDRACPGGCYWAAPGLCSRCDPLVIVTYADRRRGILVGFSSAFAPIAAAPIKIKPTRFPYKPAGARQALTMMALDR